MPKQRKSDRDGLFKRQDSPYWWYSVTDPVTGRRRRCSAKTTDRREAERVRSKHQLQGEARGERWALIAVAEDLLADKQRRGQHGYVATRLSALRGICRHIPADTIMPVPVALVRRMVADMLDAGYRPGTVNDRLRLLGRLHRYGVAELGQAWPNPVTGRLLPYQPKDRWLTRDQAAALLAAARNQADWLADYILLGLQTGLRPEELRVLAAEQIDLAHGLIRFRIDQHKSRRPDSVPLNATARALLARRLATGTGWAFTGRDGTPVARRTVAWRFQRAVLAAGIEHCTPHVLRHTAASWLVQDGVPIADVSRLLRHADVTTTARVYAHLSPDQARRAVDRLDRHAIVTPIEEDAVSA